MSKRSAPAASQQPNKKARSESNVSFPTSGDLNFESLCAPKGSGAWTVRAHVANAAGVEFSVFVSFNQKRGAYGVNFAVIDDASKSFHSDCIVDSAMPAEMLAALNNGEIDVDPLLKQALTESLKDGKVFLPTRAVDSAGKADSNGSITIGENSLQKTEKGYTVVCSNADKTVSINLNLTSGKAVRANGDGCIDVDTFSAISTRLEVSGEVCIAGAKHSVSGKGSFERRLERSLSNMNFMTVQLANGTDLLVTNDSTVVVNADGSRSQETSELKPVVSEKESEKSAAAYKSMSTLTGEMFPCAWTLSVPGSNLQLEISAAFENQELISMPARTTWTGRVQISGTAGNKKITGVGFLEQQRSNPIKSFENFVSKYAMSVRASIEAIMPRDPTRDEVAFLMSEPGYEHFMTGVSEKIFKQVIIDPLRDYVDRGETSWRSLVTLMCIEAAGNNSAQHKNWLAMPELMHVGALIIDDIEDENVERRGGPASHVTHGLDIAINAGTTAFFMPLYAMLKANLDLPVELELKLYEAYFVVLRAGHTGQALDLHGFASDLEALAEGKANAEDVLKKLLAVHRLKSAVPSSSLAKMGAMAAGGSREVQSALTHYVEAVGMAASMVRSVQNMDAKQGSRPACKELRSGKVTVALGHAVANASNDQKAVLLRAFRDCREAKTDEDSNTAAANLRRLIKEAGGDTAALASAEKMVQDTWKEVDSSIPASWAKVVLRTFGLYTLSSSHWGQ